MEHLSYSRIKTFSQCPKLYEYRYIANRVPAPSQLMLEGADEHLKIASTEQVPEFFKPAFERNFPLPVFEETIEADFLTFGLKGVIDVYSVQNVSASIADWKLLNIPEDDTQLKIYALLLSQKYPQVVFFQCYYVSLKGNFFKRYTYTIEDIQEFEASLSEIADTIQTAKDFPPRPGQHCAWCAFIKECYQENQIPLEITQITTLEQAIELARKVYIAENFLDQIKAQLKTFLLEHGLDELVFDENNRMYLSPSIALRFGKINGRKKK
ncbi:MAG: PD-(D/E)XK nuclease family protein [Nanopusillaceae archaeon]